jgi:hypothetical protein
MAANEYATEERKKKQIGKGKKKFCAVFHPNYLNAYPLLDLPPFTFHGHFHFRPSSLG